MSDIDHATSRDTVVDGATWIAARDGRSEGSWDPEDDSEEEFDPEEHGEIMSAFSAEAAAREHEIAGNVEHAVMGYEQAIMGLQRAWESTEQPAGANGCLAEQIQHLQRRCQQLRERGERDGILSVVRAVSHRYLVLCREGARIAAGAGQKIFASSGRDPSERRALQQG